MPTYTYLCTDCRATVEVRASVDEKHAGLQPACDRCGGTALRRSFQPVAIVAGGAGTSTGPAGGASGGGACCAAGCACGKN